MVNRDYKTTDFVHAGITTLQDSQCTDSLWSWQRGHRIYEIVLNDLMHSKDLRYIGGDIVFREELVMTSVIPTYGTGARRALNIFFMHTWNIDI